MGALATCLFGVAQVLEKERPHFIRESNILILLELHLQTMYLLPCTVALQEASPKPQRTEPVATKATCCCGQKAAAAEQLKSLYRQLLNCSTGQAQMERSVATQIATSPHYSPAGGRAAGYAHTYH